MKGFVIHTDDLGMEIWSMQVGWMNVGGLPASVHFVINQHRSGPWSWKLICQDRILFSSAYAGEFFNSAELALEDACAKMRLISELWNFIKDESWTK